MTIVSGIGTCLVIRTFKTSGGQPINILPSDELYNAEPSVNKCSDSSGLDGFIRSKRLFVLINYHMIIDKRTVTL